MILPLVLLMSNFAAYSDAEAARIVAWDFTGEGTVSAVTTSPADVFDSSLASAPVLTRGSGAAWSTGSNSFRTVGFKNDGISTSNTDFFEFALIVPTGKTLSLSTIDAKFAGTSSFNASPGVTSQFAYSLDGVTFALIGSAVQSTSTTLAQINLSGISALQNIPERTTLKIRYYASGQTGSGGWGFNSSASGAYGLDIGGSISESSSSTPSITLNPTSLSGLTTTTGASSSVTNYTVTGTNLGSTNITVTPNSSLIEISTNASTGFATNALNLTQTGGVVSNTVYVRVGANSTTTNISSTISHVSGSASTNLTVSGTVSDPSTPALTVAGTLSSFATTNGTASATQTLTLSGTNLAGNVTVTGPTGMEMATTGAYANPLTITASGTLTNTTVNVRIAASAAAGSITGNVSFASTNATTQNLAASGTVAGSGGGGGGGSGVFISQVYEGASNNKYVEVYNPGPSTVDLASPQIKLAIWSVTGDAGTGAATGAATTSNLTGTIPAGGALVFKNSGAANPAYIVSNATANGSVNFNGNDAIALTDNSNTILDVFGVGINNKDKNYTRNASVSGPSATFVESDWTSGANAVADSASTGVNDRLGYHQHSGGGGGTEPTISSFSPIAGAVGSSVTINGANFTSGMPVKFNGIASQLVSFASASQIVATVPEGVTTGYITVGDGAGAVVSATAFVVGDFAVTTPLDGMDFGSVSVGSIGVDKNLVIMGGGLPEGTLNIESDSPDFLLSEDGSAWSSSLAIPYDGSFATPYIRFAPLSTGAKTAVVTLSSGGITVAKYTFTGAGNSIQNVTGFAAVSGNAQIGLSWTNASPSTRVIILAQQGSAVTNSPVASNSYTASTVYGSGTQVGTSYVVFNSTGTNVTVTGLTNRLLYYFKAFNVSGDNVSSGASVSRVPYAALSNVISQWNFNGSTTTPSLGTGTAQAIGGTVVQSYTAGSPTDPLGTGGVGNFAWTLNTWTGGATETAGVQFNVSTVGKGSIVVSWDAYPSNTGPKYYRLLYTSDGSVATPVWIPYTATGSGTDSGLYVNPAGRSWTIQNQADLSGVPALQNNPNAAFRLVSAYAPSTSAYAAAQSGSTAGSDGTLRFDMVTVSGVASVFNNPPTNITLSATTIAENNAVNAVVGTLSTTDADSSDTHTYSLVSGTGSTDNASFNIAGASLRATGAFNFETKSSYSVRVRTTDLGGATFEKTFTITVADVVEGSTYTDWSGGSTLDSSGLAKYAIGGASSLTADDGVKPTSALTGGFLVITAIVRTDNSDLTVVGQAVTDLANYASNTSVTVVSGVEVADQSDVPAGHKRKTFSIAQGTDARKFMRLSASLALSGTNTTVSVARDSGGATFLQVTGATAGTTGGGSATSDKRTIYYFAPDTTSNPTYTGGAWPYVIVQGQLSAGAGVTATLTKNSSGMLLVNGLPAYQYVGDSGSTTANGVGGTWPGMKADGTKTTTGPSGSLQ